jgi:trk system potassium uptake protein TrkH
MNNKMTSLGDLFQRWQRSNALYLLAFFIVVILAGSAVLMLPSVWDTTERLSFTDAVFTATSIVCVAGLGIVNISLYSRFGQLVILLLMQIGGLGIISFSSILLTIPGNRLALMQRTTIQGFYIDGVEYRPRRIVRNIMVFTFSIEMSGAVLLSVLFYAAGVKDWLFMGVFHAVSAFCNTGISLFDTGFTSFNQHIPIMLVLMSLMTLGGVGFIVLQDALIVLRRRKMRLSYHSRIVLAMTVLLVFGGALLFFILERRRLFADMNPPVAVMNAVFQSVNTRSGGFELISQRALSQPSKMLTCLLMLIGGAPGSIAGGIKITIVFVILALIFRKPDAAGDINVFHHRLSAATIHKAVVYVLKALGLLLLCIGALTVSEGLAGKSLGAIIFEGFSAFATVGLSLGLTGELSEAGKWIIIAAMFAGRVGLIALAFPAIRQNKYEISYPEGSLLLE